MHPRVLSGDAWDLVRALGGDNTLEDWTLCGETGMALQFGHRVSEDLDFFATEPGDLDGLRGRLASMGDLTIVDRAPDTLHVRLRGIRISFLGLEAPLLFRPIPYRGLAVGDTRDIASMKLVAAGGRGSRKDFIDLYVYLKQNPGLDAIFEVLEQRDTSIDWNRLHLLKSLTYFKDAEGEPMPRMLKSITWDEVKQYFERLATSYL